MYKTINSKKRNNFKSGLIREIKTDKPRYDLVIPKDCKEPLLKRWAELMARGAIKYAERNWELAIVESEPYITFEKD